jgi:hypothetical protein
MSFEDLRSRTPSLALDGKDAHIFEPETNLDTCALQGGDILSLPGN